MPTAIVTTKVESNKQFEWYNNVFNAVIKDKVRIFDYWTNNWLPSQKINPNRIEVYYNDKLAFAGKIIDKFKKHPEDVYNQYASNLAQIGLPPNATSKDFVNMLDSYFPSRPKNDGSIEIGNIVFEIDELGFTDDKMMNKIAMLGGCKGLELTLNKHIPYKPIRRVYYI